MLTPIMRSPGAIIRGITAVLYPPCCQVCRKRLDLFSGKTLCEACHNKIALDARRGYGGCRLETRHFDALHSVCIYEGVIRECIQNFKYNGRLAIEKLFNDLMVGFAEKYLDMGRFDTLMPVPLYRAKRRERTFNQSELLAASVSKRFGIPLSVNNLIRTRSGPPQMTLPKEKRLACISGSFKIKNPGLVRARSILLIDDVFTTGATVNECSKVIKEARAASVEVFTLARSE